MTMCFCNKTNKKKTKTPFNFIKTHFYNIKYQKLTSNLLPCVFYGKK